MEDDIFERLLGLPPRDKSERERELEEENARLRKELEQRNAERRCAEIGHDWLNLSYIGKFCSSDGSNLYRCQRCGKEKWD